MAFPRFAVPLALALATATSLAFAQRVNDFPNANEWYFRTTDKAATLYVLEFGKPAPTANPERSTVVVLHGGWGSEHSYLLDAAKGLEKRYRWVFYEQRGSLRSPCPKEQVSVEKHVEDLEHLRVLLKVDRMTLFAHSMGTFLAMSYAQKYPNHVGGIVLAAPVPAVGDNTIWPKMSALTSDCMNRPEVQALLKEHGQGQTNLTPQQRSELWHITFAACNTRRIQNWRRMRGGMVFYNAEVGNATANTMPMKWDFTSVLRTRDYPVTVIDGDWDFIDLHNAFYRPFVAASPNIDYTVIKEAGHNIWTDDPDAFRKALRHGLDKTLRP